MKVYIGPYKKWWGPYQIADLLQYLGVSDDKCHEIGSKLADTNFRKFCEWIYSKRHRKIKIRIDHYDVWNADDTLAYIIIPILRKLKDEKQGVPHVDPEDCPSDYPTGENIDELVKRWEYVLNEMIWAFESMVDYDKLSGKIYDEVADFVPALKKLDSRIDNGTRLFGKYYRALWT